MTSIEERPSQAAPVRSRDPHGRVNVGALKTGVCPAAGFTLLEIMIAIGVVGLLMSALYGSYRAVADSILGIQPQSALEQKGRFWVQQLSRQIRCCYAGPVNPSSRTLVRQDDAVTDLDKPDLLFEGGGSLNDGILLRYVTSSGTRSRRDYLGCLTVVSYRLDRGRHVLSVREQVYGRPSEEDEEGWRVVLEDVLELEFEYFDGRDWRSEWDSTKSSGLPRAVRVRLVLGSSPQECTDWESVIAVPCSRPGMSKASAQQVTAGDDRRDE